MTEKAKQLGNEFITANFLQYEENGETIKVTEGLTKREYFAGLATHGLLSHYGGVGNGYDTVRASVLYANLLLEELSKTE